MCGRLNVTDDPFTQELCKALKVPSVRLVKSKDTAPGATLSIVRDLPESREMLNATWWLLLDSSSLKPNYRYASFNSRSDKLNDSRSLAYIPYRTSRCLIPASGFVEGLGDKKTYFQIEPQESAIAFGGIYKEWLNQATGELKYSASVITLPPHEKLKDIHPKSVPLMLPWHEAEIVNHWLDPNFTQVDAFNDLLVPKIIESLIVTPIDKPSKRNAISEPFIVDKDAA